MKTWEVYCFIYGCVSHHEEARFKYQSHRSLIFVLPYHIVFVKTNQVPNFLFSSHINT